MNNADYKLGDIYPGYSQISTRDKSLPEQADLEATSGAENNQQSIEVAQTNVTQTNKKSIWISVASIIGIIAVLGLIKR